MNGMDRLERELTAWFDDAATPRVPEYTADIIGATATMRQRPRWSFPTRWLPAALIPRLPHVSIQPLPWRTIALLAVLGLLLAAAVALSAGRPRVPAPFGPAENGLVVYAEDGDISTVDPVTGERRAIITGPATDLAPRWSRDGTRVAFLRQDGLSSFRLVVANADGSELITSSWPPFLDADTDSIAWSPDGRWVAMAAGPANRRTMSLVDTSTGEVRELDTPDIDVEMYWRPPGGRQLIYVRAVGDDRQLVLVDGLDAAMEAEPLGEPEFAMRPGGWSPDGERFVVHHLGLEDPYTSLLDPETGEREPLQIAFGRLSNDGTRMVGYRDFFGDPFLCVMTLPDGDCDRIADGELLPDWEQTSGLTWSPDDRWIAVYTQDGRWVLLDPEGGTPVRPAWGVESWQRVAPPAWWEWW